MIILRCYSTSEFYTIGFELKLLEKMSDQDCCTKENKPIISGLMNRVNRKFKILNAAPYSTCGLNIRLDLNRQIIVIC